MEKRAPNGGPYIFVYINRGYKIVRALFVVLHPSLAYTRIYGHQRAWYYSDIYAAVRRRNYIIKYVISMYG